MELKKTWSELKSIIYARKLQLQYEELNDSPSRYILWAEENNTTYICHIKKETEDATDFENNYKPTANEPLRQVNGDGREMIVATSRPSLCTTYFTSSGDDFEVGIIGEGNSFFYDFENDDDIIPAPSGYKRKQIDFVFIDSTWVKEGTIYFHNAQKKSYVDLFVVCPSGQYYLKNDDSVGYAQQDTPVQHFVNKLFIQGDCPMGDELNTESASEEIPSDYFYRMHITVPENDTVSNGYINLELYRERTIVLE